VGEVARDAGGKMVACLGESFSGKFQKQTTPTTGRGSREGVRPYFAPNSSGGGASKGLPGKLEGRGTGDGVLGFFGSRFFRHGDFLAQIPPNGNGNVGGLAVSLLVMEGTPKLSTSLHD
jgi:hypothetical protein